MKRLVKRIEHGLRRRWVHGQANLRLAALDEAVRRASPRVDGVAPVVLFNASTRLQGMSLNAGFQRVTAWALQMAGVPVVHFVCQGGMSRCVLGTKADDPAAMPPCAECIAQSRAMYAHSDARWFLTHREDTLERVLAELSLTELMSFEWQDLPLGALCLPGLRWALRRHHLNDDEPTRFLYREYILSAYRVAQAFRALLDEVHPQAVVVFNGMFYPEATARFVARQHGLRVISHEVGLRPFTAFFTTGDATAYPIDIPADFALTPEQEQRLDAYLEQRLQGNFTMAGVRFWPHMRGLEADMLEKIARFRQMVPVFTNVIFDTSQPHSNVLFSHMFEWLDRVLEIIRRHPETLFVIRAHPDESRPGKASRESVAQWVDSRGVRQLPNVHFVDSHEYISSYELIQRGKFVALYNSTIGLEASLMGAPVLCAGRARFTQIPTVFFPASAEEYLQQMEAFLEAESIAVPPEFRQNARRFLYYQLYKVSLPFDEFLEEDGVWNGYVRVKDLPPQAFDPRQSAVLQVIVNGILHDTPFVLEG